MGKVQISQEAFDSVVKENIEDFGMSLEEAAEDAVKTFKMQGADLKGIITDGSGGQNINSNPVIDAVKKLESATETSGETISSCMERLYNLCKDEDQTTISLAGRHGGVEATLGAFKVLGSDESMRNLAMKVLAVLVGDAENKEKFRRNEGPEMIIRVLKDQTHCLDTITQACNLISASATEDELVKEQFMDLKVSECLPILLRENANSEDVILSICNAFRALVTSDDNRVVASKGFMNARTFSECGMAEAFLKCAKVQASYSAVASICLALKSLAVNDVICKSIADDQGIDFVLQALDESMKVRNQSLARSGCSLLSQLAGSDENKDIIVYQGGLEKLVNIMSTYEDDPSVLQESFAVITAITLRSPSNALKAVQTGVLDLVLEAMDTHISSASMQRQACQMLRNLAVRSAESRTAILEKGLEPLIRRAKSNHGICKDVASAALRDLGLDDYNS